MATLKIDPTLFIFLGTSPAQVGWRLKKHLDLAYGGLPIFRYFWIDTDSEVEQNALEWLHSGPVMRSEIGDFNAGVVLRNIDNFEKIKSWWPSDTKLKPGHLGRGAKQVRSIGRLSLFRMFNDTGKDPEGSLYSKLNSSISNILAVSNKQATAAKHTAQLSFEVNENRARVFIVFSSCGGTGSGIAFDVAYLCRHILDGNSVNSTITSVTVLPPVIEKAMRRQDQQQVDKIKANTYAWFKENDFLIQNQTWNVSYPGEEVSVENTPFDVNFIVDISNQKGQFLNSEHDVYKMIAQSLFLISSTSVAGKYDSMKDNMGITNLSFKGRLRSYGSFASAALIYPKERIRNYCGCKLGEEVLSKVSEVPKALNPNQLDPATLINQLGLSHQPLVNAILNNRRVPNDSFEFIQKAELPGKALSNIIDESTNDQIELASLLDEIKAEEETKKIAARDSFRRMMLDLFKKEGPGYLVYLLDKLVEDSPAKNPTSFTGLKKAVDLYGVSLEAITAAKNELEEHKNELSEMSASFTSTAFRWFIKKEWGEKFVKVKNSCLASMEAVNNATLRNAAEQSAKTIYDELLVDARALRVIITGVLDTFTQTKDGLGNDAESFLTIPSTQLNLFELSHEAVDSNYIQKYFEDHAGGIDRLAIFHQFINQQVILNFETLSAWNRPQVSSAIRNSTESVFTADLENVNILEAMKASYGDKYTEVLKTKIDALITYCHPFWRYLEDSGLTDPSAAGPSFIGIMDNETSLFPAEYKDHTMYQVVSTGLTDSIHLVKILHGVPSSLLTGVIQWKQQYDKALRDGVDPLHVIPGAKDAEEVLPETESKPRILFALAMAFGYITKRSTHYYYDPDKKYKSLKVRPEPEHKIAAGRASAEDIFIQHSDWLDQVEQAIDNDIQAIGNIKAIEFLTEKAQELTDEKFKLDPKSLSRGQLTKEIKALEDLKKELAQV